MTKEKAREQEVKANVEETKVELTKREQIMSDWLAKRAYESIKCSFEEECRETSFATNMNFVTVLCQTSNLNAMYFICILLERGDYDDLVELIPQICVPGDDSIGVFLNAFKEYMAWDLFYEDEDDDYYEDELDDEDFDDDEPELYDVNFDPEIDEDPFAVISVAVDKEKCPQFESKMKDILQTLGITLPSFRKKECEEDE